MAFSDAAAAVGLWAAAARLGEHAVSPDPRYADTRLEVAWRTWRAGPGDALGLLAALPDEVHPLLSARVRDRTTWIVAPPLLVLLVVLIGASVGLPGDVATAGVLPLVAAGLAASSWGILTRVPGTGLAQTHRIVGALNRHRKRVGRSGLVLPVLAAVAGFGYGYGVWKRATRTTETLTRIALLPLLIGLLFAAGAVAIVVVGRWRRARLDERVPADRCLCWERDWFAGRAWRNYRDGHLTTLAADRGQGAALLRCPTTAKTWLHVGESDLTVHVVLPEPSGADRHSAAYL